MNFRVFFIDKYTHIHIGKFWKSIKLQKFRIFISQEESKSSGAIGVYFLEQFLEMEKSKRNSNVRSSYQNLKPNHPDSG